MEDALSDPKAYPKMLYGSGSDGVTMIVNSPEQETAAGAGWSTEPSDAHRSAVAAPPPLQSGQEALIEAIAARTAEVVLAAMKAPPSEPPPVPAPAAAKRLAKPATLEMPSESGE